MALLELSVTDLALIERVRVQLGAGLTVITGETGAGKSLLIDALALVSGGRSDISLVRNGASVARVEALFDRPESVDGDAGEPLICVRELAAAGRTVARMDDQAVPATRLAAVVEPLVAIHGQHDQQRLLSAARQRDLLDAFGGHAEACASVAVLVGEWRANRDALAALEMSPEEMERRLALARYVVDEVAEIDPRPGEVDELRVRLGVLTGAERSIRLADAIRASLVGEGSGVQDQAARALQDARDLARSDARLEPLVVRLEGLEAEAVDIADEVRQAAEGLEADLGSVTELEERLGLLYGLLRKYGPTEEAVLAHAASTAQELARLEGLDAERADRAQADGRLRAAAEDAARTLTTSRRASAADIASAVTAILRGLGFPEAAFSVVLTPTELTASGADDVSFLLAPNAGEPARPLARIASGGELSRVSLAIEQVLAAADTTPTLVFDEVDAGIGSRSADPVGRSLWRLARHHQVLCVTHLAQIAAHADAHLQIAEVGARRQDRHRHLGADRRGAGARDRRDARGRPACPTPPSRLPGSCWSAPWSPVSQWQLGDRAHGGSVGAPPTATRPMPADLASALETYLDHLRVERGLASATIRAYDTDLRAFGALRRASTAGPALQTPRSATWPRWAARRSRCARPASGARRPPSGPSIASVAPRSSSPRTSRTSSSCHGPRWDCRTPWTWARSRRSSKRRPCDTDLGIRDRALLELLYASGLRVSEALGLDLTDLSTIEESVRVIGKGDRERVVPVGDVALAALDRYVHDVRPAWLAAAPTPTRGRGLAVRARRAEARRGGPLFLSQRGCAHGPHGRLACRSALRGTGRIARPCDSAHVAA